MSSIAAQPAESEALAGEHARTLIRLEGVGVWESQRWLVRDVSLAIAPGARVHVVGANGAGKSTLLRVMAGLLAPTVGRVHTPDRRAIGLIAHEAMLYEDLTAAENVEFFARLHGVRDWRDRSAALLERLGVQDAARVSARLLSRGMLQRVAIARSLVHEPSVILADEPYSGLDEPARAVVESLLNERHARGAAVVVTSHGVRACDCATARVVAVREGAITLDAPAALASDERVGRAIGGGT